jgi:hypothetical protein
MKACLPGIALVLAATSCEKAAPDFGKTVQYAFSSKYEPQLSVGPATTDSCLRSVKVSGTLTFKVNQVGVTFVDAEGELHLTQTRPPLDNNTACKSAPPLSFTTALAASATGSADDVTFVVTEVGPGYTRRYLYQGTLDDKGGVGILTYDVDGTIAGVHSTNTIRVGIALVPVTIQKVDPIPKG